LNDIIAGYPDTAIHLILDNLDTHKPKNDRCLRRQPNVAFSLHSDQASWLNHVEILEGKCLHGASLTSVKELMEHIDAIIEAYNQNAKPFV
jgi:hypothetical protein